MEAICDKLRAKLRLDCYLNPNSAYDYFSATVILDLKMHDAGTDLAVKHDVVFEHDVIDEDAAPVDVEAVRTELDIQPEPPNVVRETTGQPIPVLTTDSRGKTAVKRVQYARPSSKQSAKRAAAKGAVLLLCALGASRLVAQAKPAAQPAKPAAPTVQPFNPASLTNTERIAIQAVLEERGKLQAQMNENTQKLQAIQDDFPRTHPGFQYDPQTQTFHPLAVKQPQKPEDLPKPIGPNDPAAKPQNPAAKPQK